jgi:hypothetical protein
MKKLNAPWLYSAIFLLFISSCTKENVTAVPVTTNNPVQQNKELRLIVTNWQIDRNNLLSATFTGILRYNTSASSIKVYVIPNSGTGELLISNGPIYFSGGDLWSEQSGYDLKIMFRPYYPNIKLYEKLSIKIVFE